MPGVTDTFDFVVCCVGAPGPHVLNVRHTLVCAAGAGAAPALACPHACSLSTARCGCSTVLVWLQYSPLVACLRQDTHLEPAAQQQHGTAYVCHPGFCMCLPVESRRPGVVCCVGCCCCCCAVCCSPHALGTLYNLSTVLCAVIEGGGLVHSSA